MTLPASDWSSRPGGRDSRSRLGILYMHACMLVAGTLPWPGHYRGSGAEPPKADAAHEKGLL